MTIKPNFFIVGAPKCGTTAMSEYLRTHPNVYMSVPKEPHFFSSDIWMSPYVRNMDEYIGLFRDVSPGKKVVGEASADYLMSASAVQKIADFSPDAKILVMLRNPVDIVRSFHGQLLKHGSENVVNFEDAWNLQLERSTGISLPPGSEAPKLLQYEEVARLGTQLQRLFSTFTRDRVHIVLFEDLCRDPGQEYRRLLSFLELPSDERSDFPRVNEAVQYKWLWLGQFPKRLRGQVARPLATLRRRTGWQGTGLLKMLDRFNAVPATRPPLRPEFKRHLEEVFSNEIRLLEELLRRDLSHWRRETAREASACGSPR